LALNDQTKKLCTKQAKFELNFYQYHNEPTKRKKLTLLENNKQDHT